MKSLSTVGLGLSIIFGILLLALIAEVYYLLWWKNRITSRDRGSDISNPAADLLYVFCWKKQSSMTQTAAVVDTYSLVQQDRQQQQHDQFNINRDLLLKPLGNETSGPPKFLFPIIEETWEEMESEDSRLDSRGRSSLSELLLTAETPYVTPVASPSMLTHPLTSSSSSPIHGLNNNHVSESAREAEFNRRKSSPPPKFKFLQDAEEKFRRKLMEQDGNGTSGSKDFKDEEEDEPYVAIVVDKNQETVSKSNRHHQQFQFSYSPPALSKFS